MDDALADMLRTKHEAEQMDAALQTLDEQLVEQITVLQAERRRVADLLERVREIDPPQDETAKE